MLRGLRPQYINNAYTSVTETDDPMKKVDKQHVQTLLKGMKMANEHMMPTPLVTR
jgi:hypothetical protein